MIWLPAVMPVAAGVSSQGDLRRCVCEPLASLAAGVGSKADRCGSDLPRAVQVLSSWHRWRAGVGSGEGSYEYLVFTSTLLGVAAKHGLVPVSDWDDPDLDACFDEVWGP